MSGEATAPGNATVRQFVLAHDMLKEQYYEAAAVAFGELLTSLPADSLDEFSKKYYSDNAAWNRLLALLGAQQTAEQFAEELQNIIDDPSHQYREEAVTLQRKLNSFWRRFVSH